MSLARCCILAAVLPREGVARIFVTHGRTDGQDAREMTSFSSAKLDFGKQLKL